MTYGMYPYQFGKQEVVRVNGENGARAYQLPPNSSILLLDDTAPLVWLCVTDGAGYKTVTPYSITPYEPEPPVDMKALEERLTRLEGKINHVSHDRTAKQYPVIVDEADTRTV